jgi:choline dehydrogenase-like flavoprotein
MRAPRLDYEMPEFEGRDVRLSDVLDAPPFDACIVGSGPAGAVLGLQLARAGVRTVILEAGVNPSRITERYAQLNVATQSGDTSYPLIATRAMMPGGTTALWTGNTPRLLPIDFERNAYTPEGTAWPVSYEEMSPYYDLAEQTLHVAGEANAAYAAPRTRPLAQAHRGSNRAVKALLKRADVSAFDTFRSRMQNGGPTRIARDVLPEFSRLPSAAFVQGATARRFVSGSPDRIEGVEVSNADGARSILRARTYILAAGGIECARRLLLSRSESFPEGLGNRFDQVGRTFTDHLQRNFTARVRPDWRLRWADLPQTVRSYQFYESSKREGIGGIALFATLRKTSGPEVELLLTGSCELEPVATNRVTLDESQRDVYGDAVAHLHFNATERDRITSERMVAIIRDVASKVGAHELQELPPHWAHHHLGTVRMGNDERTSVVDRHLKVHGVRNAYVLTSGNFVTCGPANPTLLIVALAHRLAGHLIAELRSSALELTTTKVDR